MSNEDLLETIENMSDIYCFNDDFITLSLLYRVYVCERDIQNGIDINAKRYEITMETVSYIDMYDL